LVPRTESRSGRSHRYAARRVSEILELPSPFLRNKLIEETYACHRSSARGSCRAARPFRV
jgi:hypothetical protein